MTLIAISAVAFGLLALAWVAYPAAMWLRARGRAAGTESALAPTEQVVVVVRTRNDPVFAVERVRNLRATAYPSRLIQVVVAVDVNSSHSIDSYRKALLVLAELMGESKQKVSEKFQLIVAHQSFLQKDVEKSRRDVLYLLEKFPSVEVVFNYEGVTATSSDTLIDLISQVLPKDSKEFASCRLCEYQHNVIHVTVVIDI